MEYQRDVHSQIRSKVWAIAVLLPEMLSLAITMFRLLHRWRARLLWWDDYLAFVALLAAVPFYWTTWVLVIGKTYSPAFQIAVAWIGIVAFLLTLWLTKISLALSIARVVYAVPKNTIFRWLLSLVYLIGVLGLASAATRCGVCATYGAWQRRAPYMCPATPLGSILPYTASITSDIALVLTPLRLFWNVQLPPVAKRLILVGFAASCMLVPIDAVNTAYGFMALGGTSKGVALRALFMHLAAVISLVACNALVVLTSIYRWRKRENLEFISELTALSKAPTTRVISLRFTAPTAWTLPNSQARSTALTEVSIHSSEFDESTKSNTT